jgi:hypothetical protein
LSDPKAWSVTSTYYCGTECLELHLHVPYIPLSTAHLIKDWECIWPFNGIFCLTAEILDKSKECPDLRYITLQSCEYCCFKLQATFEVITVVLCDVALRRWVSDSRRFVPSYGRFKQSKRTHCPLSMKVQYNFLSKRRESVIQRRSVTSQKTRILIKCCCLQFCASYCAVIPCCVFIVRDWWTDWSWKMLSNGKTKVMRISSTDYG